jgi:GDPmannose 4,6-dehydratase
LSHRAIIFGGAGQDGLYLQEIISNEGGECIVTARSRSGYTHCDVGRADQVEEIVRAYRPEYVFHFAAKSSADHNAIHENQKAIVDGTLNILEAVKRYAPDCKVFLSGSALQFLCFRDPIDESSDIGNASAYAAQRNASLCLARYYRSNCGICAYFGYFFHHDSPRRRGHHLAQRVASAAARIKDGSNEKVDIYEPDAEKEWTFAGDSMEAAWLLVRQNAIHECVIGSGVSHSVGEWAEACFDALGLDWKDHVILHENTIRKASRVVSRPDRLKALGWRQKVSFPELANLMVSASMQSLATQSQ